MWRDYPQAHDSACPGNLISRAQCVAHHQSKQEREINHRCLQHMTGQHLGPVSYTHLGGKVFYKVREQALDPRNFKDSSDVGTLVVRYVVMPQGDKNTV